MTIELMRDPTEAVELDLARAVRKWREERDRQNMLDDFERDIATPDVHDGDDKTPEGEED